MQHTLQSMIGFSIQATDGNLGKVSEFYFDDATWTIRYMVVETGNWLADRKVLISLVALVKPDWEARSFSVSLTRDQIRNSPDIDTERPVSRQHETELHKYYQWLQYWEGGYQGTFGLSPYPLFETPLTPEATAPERRDDLHLRSTREVTGYHIHATDGQIGHVKDFMVDDENWAIRYLLVDTGNWLPGMKVRISPKWIKSVNWIDAGVHLDRPRESVRNRPEFEPVANT